MLDTLTARVLSIAPARGEPGLTRADIIAVMEFISAVTVEEMKEAWPKFLRQQQQAAGKKPMESLPTVLNIRCGILLEALNGQQPTEQWPAFRLVTSSPRMSY